MVQVAIPHYYIGGYVFKPKWHGVYVNDKDFDLCRIKFCPICGVKIKTERVPNGFDMKTGKRKFKRVYKLDSNHRFTEWRIGSVHGLQFECGNS